MKSSVWRLLLVGVCLLAVGQVAQAVRLDALFQAEVPAAGRTAEARREALTRALGQVLVRVTGDETVVGDPAVQPLLRDAGRYVVQYRFSEPPADPRDEENSGPELLLWAQFDEVALARALREHGLPYWGRDRPDVLVWLAVDDHGNRFLVSETSDDPLASALRESAQRRGLPVNLPLLDLQDQQAVHFSDLWGGFFGPVQRASERYRPQVVLIGRVGSAAAGWSGQWSLLGAGASSEWSVHGATPEEVVDRGVAEAVGLLATQYAMVDTTPGSRLLAVRGVTGLGDYARVQRYLASLSPVEQVQVALVGPDQVRFALRLNAPEQNLLQLIRLGRVLEPVGEQADWQFRLAE